MSATLAVLTISVLAGVLLVALGRRRGPTHQSEDVIDPTTAEHWLIERVGNRPRLRRAIVATDRRVVGGVAVAASFVVLFVAALAVGAVFDSIGTDRGFARWDQAVSRWGPDHASTTGAEILRELTNFGGTLHLLILMTAVGIVDWIRRRDGSSLLFLVTVGVGVSLINNGLKLVIMRERPPGEHLVNAAGSSFPSGHSAAAAACWLAIALVVGRWAPLWCRRYVSGAAVAIACMVAASRALLGVHWLTDVIAGVFVGWAWFVVVAIAFGGRRQHLGEPAERLAVDEREQLLSEHHRSQHHDGRPDTFGATASSKGVA
jgi:undecaprenyl-diphosphatase